MQRKCCAFSYRHLMKGVQNKLEDFFFDETCQSMREILQLPVFKVKGGSHLLDLHFFHYAAEEMQKHFFFSTLEDSQCYEVTFVFLH